MHIMAFIDTTLESKIIPGLFFAGEILDVDGITGGFNFQHAWASAFIVAEEMGKLYILPKPINIE